MLSSSSIVTTDHASRYLQQLCKHFGHKVPVEYVPEEGRINFPFGTCTLRAEGASLILTAVAESDNRDRLEQVIGDHLARFAFREKITVTWQRTEEKTRSLHT